MPERNIEVLLTEEVLSDFTSSRSKWAKQAVEDNEFRNGKQWTQKQKNTLRSRAQEPLVVNVIHPAVEQAKALLTTNKPKFQSTAREDSDVRTGRVFSDLMAWIWDYNNGNSTLKQIIDDYYVKGMGVAYAYSDPNEDFGKGEIMFKSIDPLEIYLDPSCKDPFCQDSPHIIIGKKIMQSQLISLYPQAEEIIKAAIETNHLSPSDNSRVELQDEEVSLGDVPFRSKGAHDQDRELELIERLTKVKMTYWRCFDTTLNREEIRSDEEYQQYLQQPAFILATANGDVGYVTEPNAVQQMQQLYEESNGVFHYQQDPQSGQVIPVPGPEHESPTTIPGSTTQMELVTIEALVEGGIINCVEFLINRIQQVMQVGDELISNAVIPIEHYPVVTIMNRHNRNPYPLSDVRIVKGLQEYINKIRSLIVAHASSSTNTKLLIPRGSMDKKILEEEWARAGTAVIEYDPELGQPIVAGPVPIPNELYKNEADAKADVERILGIYAMMQGDQSAAPQTYKGTIALDEFGQRRIRSKKDDIEAGLNQMARVMVELIQYTYTDQKVLRILQPNSAPKETKINEPIYDEVSGEFLYRLNDVTMGKYDVVVVSGSTLPTNRWARFEYYKELYSMQVIDQVELLKQTDVIDMEGVLNRADQRNQMMSQIQQLTEQNKKLEGDLQTAQRESTHDRKRVEVKEFEKKLAKLEAKMEMVTKLYEARASDELKKIKESLSEVQANDKKASKEVFGIPES